MISKLDTIIQNQLEQLGLLRRLAASSSAADDTLVLDDVLPQRLQTLDELRDFNQRLATKEFRKKMVITTAFYLFHITFPTRIYAAITTVVIPHLLLIAAGVG